MDKDLDNKFFEFYHWYNGPTRTWRSQTQEIDYEKELEELEHLKHELAHHDHHGEHDSDEENHGHHEIEWTDEQKFPHVADRLGYPILAFTPIEYILGFEHAPGHPNYQY